MPEVLRETTGENSKSAWAEAVYRLNQLPQLYPIDEKVAFGKPDHEFMILRKTTEKFWPQVNYLSITTSARINIPLPPYNESLQAGVMPLVSGLYNLSFDWGVLGFGLLAGIGWNTTHHEVPFTYNLLIYTIALQFRYCTNFTSPVFFVFDLEAGAGINQFLFTEDSSKNSTATKFLFNTGAGVGFNFLKRLGVSVKINYTMMTPFDRFITTKPRESPHLPEKSSSRKWEEIAI